MNFSSKHWNKIGECFNSTLSNSSKYFCLYLLFNGGEGNFYLGEIAKLLNCSQRSAGKCISQLLKQGFIERTLVSHDRSFYKLVGYKK